MSQYPIIKQIMIAGAGTGAWWNLGDDVIFAAMVDDLRARYPNIHIGVLSINPQDALRDYNVQEIPIQDIQQIIDFAQGSDMLIMGGGGFFFDYWGFNVTNLLTSQHTGSGFYIDFSLLATLFKKPLIFYSIGVGPLHSDIGRQYTRLTFEQASLITVRDVESRDLLISLGIQSERIHVTADPAFRYKEIPAELGVGIINTISPGFLRAPIIGVALRDWDVDINSENFQNSVAHALDKFIETFDARVIFLPFHRVLAGYGVDDYQASAKILQRMKHADSAVLLEPELGRDEKISVLRNCDLILGMRLHANIFAVRYGIPCVGLAYDPKVSNFFASINKTEYCLDISSLTSDSLWLLIKKTYVRRDSLRKEYIEIHRSLFESAGKTLDIIDERLNHADKLPHGQMLVEANNLIHSLLIEQTLRSHTQQEQIVSLHQQAAQIQAKVTSLNQEITSLNQKSVEQNGQIAYLYAQINSLKQTFSWKITRPLRFLIRLFRNPYQTMLELSKHLPASFLTRLVLFFRRLIRIFSQKTTGASLDLTWAEFQSQILTLHHNFKGVFVLYSTIDWNFPFAQRPQPLSLALAKLGYLVVYHTPNHTDHVYDVRQVAQNVWITSIDIREIDIESAVHSIYSTSPTTPLDTLEKKRQHGQVLVYEYIDHVSPMISGEGEIINKLIELKNFAFSGGVDYVVASARRLELEAAKAIGREKVLYIPNGVDIQHYRNNSHQKTKLPDNLLDFRQRYQTLVGYFGAIAPWLWYEMMDELVLLRPDLGFVFIGPDYNGAVTHLPKSPNVLYLGAVAYDVLPAYAQSFDVCLIPFAPGDIAHTTSPLKLFEYFAMEKPVVVTSFMDECVAYGDVFSGDSAPSISAAIDAAFLVKDDQDYKTRLRLLADHNSWDERALVYETIFLSSQNAG